MNMNGFMEWSVQDILAAYRKKELTPVEVAEACIRQVEKYEDTYHAWVCFNAEELLKQAQNSEESLLNGAIRPLEGIPVGIKDIFNTNNFPTEMGSPLWKGFTPGNDARVVYQLKMAGATVPGKTVTAEFAVHTLGETLNPHNVLHNPGTSSSGSAVAVALGMVPVALGTQTAGSIVRPASFCGVYGFKPSFGLVPRTGMLKTTDSLDTVGFFVRHAADLKSVWDVVRVHGKGYPISYEALEDSQRQVKAPGRPWRVGFAKTHVFSEAPAYAQDALVTWVKQLSRRPEIEVEEVHLPELMKESHDVHATIYNRCLAYYFKEEYTKAELVSPIMNDLICRGNQITNDEHQLALRKQEQMAAAMDELMKSFDVIVSLSTAGAAPLRDEAERPDPALMWTMTHLPVVSVPQFLSPDGLPFGMQFVSRRYNDLLLMQFIEELRVSGEIPEGCTRIKAV